MKDALAREAVEAARSERIVAILEEVCQLTGMGFAAVARVTDERWIACQVVDKIEFGLVPGDELKLKTTICEEIRQSGEMVIIDHVAGNAEWRTHHTPILYGFESYASLPIVMADGSFFGTLCAIDPAPRELSSAETIATLRRLAHEVSGLLRV